MPALRDEALRPATVEQIQAIIGKRFELFPQPKRDPGQWAAWWREYLEVLNGLTPYAVEAGMAAWVRDPEAEFMCKPGKLAELARSTPHENPWARAHHRAQKATAVVEAPKPAAVETGPRPTKAEIDAVLAPVLAKLADMDPLAKMQLKRRPPPCARVDETGISQEARALLQQQKEMSQ